MHQVFLNYNGNIVPEDTALFSANHSFFRHGNSLYETMLWKDGEIRFLNYHMERLRKSMQILRYTDVSEIDAFFIKSKTEELIRKNYKVGQEVQVRLTLFRGGEKGTGSYARTNYLIQLEESEREALFHKRGLIVGLYSDVKKDISEVSRLKMNNVLVHALAEGYKQREDLDEVFLLNSEGMLCEGLSSNIFVYYQGALYTPALNQGCVEGIMRRIVMEIGEEEGIEVVEAEIDPEILNVADEIFCTNTVKGVQWIMGFDKKRYFNRISALFHQKIKTWGAEQEL